MSNKHLKAWGHKNDSHRYDVLTAFYNIVYDKQTDVTHLGQIYDLGFMTVPEGDGVVSGLQGDDVGSPDSSGEVF